MSRQFASRTRLGEKWVACRTSDNTLFDAAPDLYRALLSVEWAHDDCSEGYCPSCEQWEKRGHREGCALNAALKKARGET